MEKDQIKEGKLVKVQIDNRGLEKMVVFELKEKYISLIKKVETREAIVEWVFPIDGIQFEDNAMLLKRNHGTLEIYEPPKQKSSYNGSGYNLRKIKLKEAGLI